MTGHATPEEKEVGEQLERNIDVKKSTVRDLLDLGILYVEPMHSEDKAITLFESVLKREPTNSEAKIWLAYCCIHYLIVAKALKRAKKLLESVIKSGKQYVGCAYMLLEEVLEDLGKLAIEKKIKLLESSVNLEPDWVSNHYSLAWAYKEAGRFSDAIIQMKQAIANIITPTPEMTLPKEAFEMFITHRLSQREFYESDLEKMLNEQKLER